MPRLLDKYTVDQNRLSSANLEPKSVQSCSLHSNLCKRQNVIITSLKKVTTTTLKHEHSVVTLVYLPKGAFTAITGRLCEKIKASPESLNAAAESRSQCLGGEHSKIWLKG